MSNKIITIIVNAIFKRYTDGKNHALDGEEILVTPGTIIKIISTGIGIIISPGVHFYKKVRLHQKNKE